MTATTPVSSTTNSSASAAGSVDTTEIASNFTEFLQLLTTQLQNQDPLSPMDTNQFTQQLVEFAQVEQQIEVEHLPEHAGDACSRARRRRRRWRWSAPPSWSTARPRSSPTARRPGR